MDVAEVRSLCTVSGLDTGHMPEKSYERVAALAKSYRSRMAEAGTSTARRQSLGCLERIKSLLNEEAARRGGIEDDERDGMHAVVGLWTRRWSVFASEHCAIGQIHEKKAELVKERVLLERQLYREQFLEFWKRERQEGPTRPADITKVLTKAYKYDVLPFAADPVECWGRSIVVPPELQVSPELSDVHGTVLFPPFHELSMKLREAYNQCLSRQGSAVLAREVSVHRK